MVQQGLKSVFHGCYIATLTPFTATNILDTGVLEAHSQWLVEMGIDGLCPAGTTGEFLFLTHQEKMLAATHSVKAVRGRVPVIAGIWGNTVSEVQGLAAHAMDCGANAVFLPPPIYYPAGDDSIHCWYSRVRDAVGLPVFAYNIPQYAANEISLECLDRLFADGAIAGVKDSTGKADRVTALVTRYGHQHVVFAASDGFASRGRLIGADGFISAIGNAAPALFANLWGGDDSLQPRVDVIRNALKQIGSIPALKVLIGQLGFAFGTSRIPCSEVTPDQRKVLDGLVELMK